MASKELMKVERELGGADLTAFEEKWRSIAEDLVAKSNRSNRASNNGTNSLHRAREDLRAAVAADDFIHESLHKHGSGNRQALIFIHKR